MPAWAGSDRRQRLPANWSSIRADVFARDGYRCTVIMSDDQRCPSTDDLECDHVLRGDDHRPFNLRTICAFHHAEKSSQEGNEARALKQAKVSAKYRRSEGHPGSLG